jgi:shikimate kinase
MSAAISREDDPVAGPADAGEAGPGIVLVGPPGSGKSSVGRLLASELGVPFADTDDLVAREAGKAVGDIFIEDGELVFRELERAAVARGLDAIGPDGGVLALGSGAVLDLDVRRMISKRAVIYLEAEFATVAKRSGLDRPRVVVPGNPRGQLRAMLAERRPVYEDVASLTFPTDGMAAEEVAADLVKQLSSGGSGAVSPASP